MITTVRSTSHVMGVADIPLLRLRNGHAYFFLIRTTPINNNYLLRVDPTPIISCMIIRSNNWKAMRLIVLNYCLSSQIIATVLSRSRTVGTLGTFLIFRLHMPLLRIRRVKSARWRIFGHRPPWGGGGICPPVLSAKLPGPILEPNGI